jgi:D-psicose/D-tagatose/L-ribulose 3-epimerase
MILHPKSFPPLPKAIRAATCVWRQLAPSSDVLVSEGLNFLKTLERRYYGASAGAAR